MRIYFDKPRLQKCMQQTKRANAHVALYTMYTPCMRVHACVYMHVIYIMYRVHLASVSMFRVHVTCVFVMRTCVSKVNKRVYVLTCICEVLYLWF